MNRPPTPDHSAPRDAFPAAAPVSPWPETGLPPYGDSAYGDSVYGDSVYGGGILGDAPYGDSPFGGSGPTGRPARGLTSGRGTAERALRQAAAPGGCADRAGAPAAGRAEPELRVIVPQHPSQPSSQSRSQSPPPSQPRPGAFPGRPAVAGRAGAIGFRRWRAGRAPHAGVLAAADCAAGLAGLCAAGPSGAGAVLPAVLVCVLLAAHRRAGLYRPGLAPAVLDEVPAIALATVLAWGLAAAVLAATAPDDALGWPGLLRAAALTGCAAVVLRALAHRAHRRGGRRAPAATLVIGPLPAARRLAVALADHREYGLAPVATATPAPAPAAPGHLPAPVTLTSEAATPAPTAAAPGHLPAPVALTPKAATPAAPAALTPRAAPAIPAAGRAEEPAVLPAHRGGPQPPSAAAACPGAPGPLPPDLPHLTAAADIAGAAARHAVRHAVVVGPAGPATAAAVELLAARGCRIWQAGPAAPGSGSARPGSPRSAHLWGYACREMAAAPQPWRLGKRAMDVVLSGLALAAASPVLGVCALAVRLTDGPGVLFRQERVGLGGRPFTLLKFRTLRPGDDQEAATLWNVAHDHRVSRVGRLLRRTSMDELPQFWNVLRGDMSLVGPRPERPFFVQQFSSSLPGYQDRHRMPAGITGLAQVHGLRGDTSIPDRVRFDNHYIDSWSLWQDVAILLRTAASLFRLGGS